jgi:hypothetical protein
MFEILYIFFLFFEIQIVLKFNCNYGINWEKAEVLGKTKFGETEMWFLLDFLLYY